MDPIYGLSTDERRISDPKHFFKNSRKFFFQNSVKPSEYGSSVINKSHRRSKDTYRGSTTANIDPPPISKIIDKSFRVPPTNHLYDWFLGFKPIEYRTLEVMNEYRSFCRFGANLPFALFLCLPLCFLFFTEANGLWFSRNMNQAFEASFFFACATTVLGLVVSFNRMSLFSYDFKITWLRKFYLGTIRRMESPYSMLPEDLIIVFAALTFSLAMLGRVISGKCDADLPIYYDQGCNPEAHGHKIPLASFLVVIIVVLFCQVFMKNASRSAIIFSWAVNVVLTNASLFLIGSNDYVWINCVLFMFIAISYEIQRQSVCLFLGQKLMNNETIRLGLRLGLYYCMLHVDKI
jgi:hypothetical protein